MKGCRSMALIRANSSSGVTFRPVAAAFMARQASPVTGASRKPRVDSRYAPSSLPGQRRPHFTYAPTRVCAAAGKTTGGTEGTESERWAAAKQLWDTVDWEQLATIWQGRYWDVVDFVLDHGRFPRTKFPQSDLDAAGKRLKETDWEYTVGRWVSTQSEYCPRLTRTQKQLLKALPGWIRSLDPLPVDQTEFDANCEAYDRMATQLKRVLSQSPAASSEERKLCRWLIDMRGYHSNNDMLTAEQQQKLEQLPYFVWAVKSSGKKGPSTRKRPQLD